MSRRRMSRRRIWLHTVKFKYFVREREKKINSRAVQFVPFFILILSNMPYNQKKRVP